MHAPLQAASKRPPPSPTRPHQMRVTPPPTPCTPWQAYDTWFFFAHRYMHQNKFLFRHVHGMHHRSDAYLNVTSNSFEHPLDGLLVVGIPVGLIAWLGCWLNNWWAVMVPLHTVACIFVFGERGGGGAEGAEVV